MRSFWYIVLSACKVEPFFSDLWYFFLCSVGKGGILHQPCIRIFLPFLSLELHPAVVHPYDLLDFKRVFIICEGVSLNMKQGLDLWIFTCFYRKLTCWKSLSNHVTQLSTKSGNFRNGYNSKLCYCLISLMSIYWKYCTVILTYSVLFGYLYARGDTRKIDAASWSIKYYVLLLN